MPILDVKPFVGDHQSRGEKSSGSTALIWYTVRATPGTMPWEAEAAVPFGYGQVAAGDPKGRAVTAINAQAIPDINGSYRVAVEFSDALGEVVLNPLARLFRPSLDFEENREPIYVDGDGNAILNSAGNSFDPPIEETFSDPVFTLINNVDTLRSILAMQYKGAVNTDPILGAAAGELKITGAAINPLEENGVKYYQEIWRITGRPNRVIGGTTVKGWARLILDEGRYQKASDINAILNGASVNTVTLTPILGEDGDPVVDPVKLNGAGYLLQNERAAAPTGKFISSTDGKSAFRLLDPIKQAAFAVLQLKIGT